jgi:hypothetical protein
MKRLALGLVSAAIAAAIPATSLAAEVNVNSVPAPPSPAVVVEPAAPEAAPPPLEVQNPEMVVVPSGNSYVYMVPNTYGVYFHNGFWFRYYNGVWFRSTVYNSGWVVVRPALVPRVVIGVYPEYAMYLPTGYFRIGWGDFYGHWRGWGRSHYWHNQPWFKREMRADIRRDRMRHIDRQRGSWARGEGQRPAGFHNRPAGPHGGVRQGAVHNRPVSHGSSRQGAVHKSDQHEKGNQHGGPR